MPFAPRRSWLVPGLILSCIAAASAAPPAKGPLPDWPCPTPQSGDLTAGQLAGRALPASLPLPDAWRADPAVRAVVEFAAAPENPPDAGIARLDALAAAAGTNRQAALLEALEGIAARTNTLRGFITEGIGNAVVKSRLIAETLAGYEKSLAALPPDAAEKRKELENAEFWARRALGDAGDSAELLCHRLDYAAAKAKRLGGRIAGLLGPS